jgi:hypothetical protein
MPVLRSTTAEGGRTTRNTRRVRLNAFYAASTFAVFLAILHPQSSIFDLPNRRAVSPFFPITAPGSAGVPPASREPKAGTRRRDASAPKNCSHPKKIKQLAIMVKTAGLFYPTINPEDMHRVPLMAGVSSADQPRSGLGSRLKDVFGHNSRKRLRPHATRVAP